MKTNYKFTLLLSAVIFCTSGDDAEPANPLEHAPIGVMGEHTHQEGDWMFSYRHSRMHMDGNRDGTDDVSTAEVLSDFMVAPLEMDMEMHMFGAMYGVTNDLTLMTMVPYIRKEMDHITRGGATFTTKTSGIGDVKVSGLYNLYKADHDTLLMNLGVAIPTGSIDERDNTPAAANALLPYPMQLGSGTVDPFFSLTYTSHQDGWSWGGQAGTLLRLYDNSDDYHLGDEHHATAWIANQVTDVMSVSFRLDGKVWGDISGANPGLSPGMVPTARTDLRGGERVDALIGANLVAPDGPAAGNRLAVEFGTPIYQHLDGPQLETDYRLTLGWQYAF